jgi:hypothetical protein
MAGAAAALVVSSAVSLGASFFSPHPANPATAAAAPAATIPDLARNSRLFIFNLL